MKYGFTNLGEGEGEEGTLGLIGSRESVHLKQYMRILPKK